MSSLLTADDIALLVAHGEDAKLELHHTASKKEEAEFIKDLLSLVNAYGEGPSYLLIGMEDQTDIPHDITGLNLREPNLQHFVREKSVRNLLNLYTFDSGKGIMARMVYKRGLA